MDVFMTVVGLVVLVGCGVVVVKKIRSRSSGGGSNTGGDSGDTGRRSKAP